MPQFYTPLRFQDDGGLPFTLLGPLSYVTEVFTPGTIVVPQGFKTDLASIPQLLWNILPPIGKYDAAAVVHDCLYQNNGCTRGEADAVLREAMEVLGVGRIKRTLIYAGVRSGGWLVWKRYRDKVSH